MPQKLFSVVSVPILYHEDQRDSESWDGGVSREIGASQRGPEPWNTEAQGSCYREATGEDIEASEDSVRATLTVDWCELAIAL